MLKVLSAKGYNSNTAKYLLNEHAPAAIERINKSFTGFTGFILI